MLVVAALLAAGAGARFHGKGHKLLAELHGRPVVGHALDHALASRIGPVIVVTGPVGLSELVDHAGASDLAADLAGVEFVHNPAWESGQASSISVAVAAADRMGADQIVFGLGDQPFIEPAAWRAIASAPRSWPIVVASYDGRRGPHPVRLDRSIWPMLPATGDDGARRLIRDHSALVHDVPCPGSAADIDTLEDLNRWKSS